MQAAETAAAEAIATDSLHPHHFSASSASFTAGRDDSGGTLGSIAVLRKVWVLMLLVR